MAHITKITKEFSDGTVVVSEFDEAGSQIRQSADTPPATVVEEAPPELKQGKLPDDFPGHAALTEAGIHTYAQVRKAGDLTEISGIGEATAAKIAEAMEK